MENFEDDTADITATTDLEVEVLTMENLSPTAQRNESLDNSVILVEPTVDLVDLTTQPSTSSSGGAVGAGACSLLKTNLGEGFKEGAADTLLAAALDQNPCSSSAITATASTSSTTNVLECPICLQTCIHPARLPCGHIFCFLCVKGVAYKNRRCAMCRREIPPEFLDHPQLVNGIEDICTTKATDDGYQWFYEGRNGGWWAYEERKACEIEEAYKRLSNKQTQVKKEEETQTKPEVTIQVKTEPNIEVKIEVKNKDANDDENEDNDENEFEDDVDDIDDDESEDNYFPNYHNYFNPRGASMAYNTTNNNNQNPLTYEIEICGTMYIVDFENMIQYPQSMPYRKRKICRAKGLQAKGVCGLSSRYTNKRNNYRTKPY